MRFLALSIGVLFWVNAIGQETEMAISWGGTSADEVRAVAVNAAGDVIVCGVFKSTCDFDPTVGVSNLDSDGQENGFVASYSSTGALQWVKHVSSDYEVHLNDLVVNSAGEIVVTGYGKGYIILDPEGEDDNIHLGQSNEFEAFVFKLNSSGSRIWTRAFADDNADENNSYGYSLALDSNDDIWCGGNFNGDIDFDYSVPGSFEMSTNGETNTYVCKLADDGSFIWAGRVRTGSFVWPFDMICDSDDNVLWVSNFAGYVDFDPASATATTINGGTERDAFVCRLNSVGEFDTVYHIGGTGDVFGLGLDLGANGDIVFTGTFSGTLDADPGEQEVSLSSNGCGDAFVCRLTEEGEFVWANSFGGTMCDNATKVRATSEGGAVVVGYFFDTVDFPTIQGTSQITSLGHTDIYLQKFDQNGNGQWVSRIGGSNSDQPKDMVLNGEELLLGGYFRETVDFDVSAGYDPHTSVINSSDAFVMSVSEPVWVNVSEREFESIEVYPNPSNGVFFINSDRFLEYELLDASGRLIWAGKGSGKQTIEVEDSGIYFLVAEDETGRRIQQKIIIQ